MDDLVYSFRDFLYKNRQDHNRDYVVALDLKSLAYGFAVASSYTEDAAIWFSENVGDLITFNIANPTEHYYQYIGTVIYKY